jgi:hypothetical protein
VPDCVGRYPVDFVLSAQPRKHHLDVSAASAGALDTSALLAGSASAQTTTIRTTSTIVVSAKRSWAITMETGK